MASAPVETMKSVLGKVRNLLPFSDAKEGPLSKLTESGKSLVYAVGEGIRKAGPGVLIKPLESITRMGIAIPSTAPPEFVKIPKMREPAQKPGLSVIVHQRVGPINISNPGGNIEGVKKAVDLSMRESEARLKAAIQRIFEQERRVSFA